MSMLTGRLYGKVNQFVVMEELSIKLDNVSNPMSIHCSFMSQNDSDMYKKECL